MLWLVLIVFAVFSLTGVLAEKTIFYKDIRFWILMISFGVLAFVGLINY